MTLWATKKDLSPTERYIGLLIVHLTRQSDQLPDEQIRIVLAENAALPDLGNQQQDFRSFTNFRLVVDTLIHMVPSTLDPDSETYSGPFNVSVSSGKAFSVQIKLGTENSIQTCAITLSRNYELGDECPADST